MRLIKVRIYRGHYSHNNFHVVYSEEDIQKLKSEYYQIEQEYSNGYEIYKYDISEVDLINVEMQELDGLKLIDFIKIANYLK